MTGEFEIWLDDAPLVPVTANGQFETWLDDAPVLEGGEGTNPLRRRSSAIIFIE